MALRPGQAGALAIAAAAAVCAAAAAAAAAHGRRARQQLLARLEELERQLVHAAEKRAAERTGRIKAEQRLNELQLQLAAAAAGAAQGDSGGCSAHWLFTAVGQLHSVFSDRRGTPRQPHLVPAARAVLRLAPGVPPSCLQGLQHFSHVWVLFVFSENTGVAKALAARAAAAAAGADSSSAARQALHTAGVKSSVRVPRLNGGKMGVLATRSPHRPVPIGLSTAEVLHVDAEAGVLVLGGADIVDGSPVLDVKPYVPFSDALAHATAPDWVTAEADEEPLALGGVVIDAPAAAALDAAWQQVQRTSLYGSPAAFRELVSQVLARDIRSLHQRVHVLPLQPAAAAAAAAALQQQQPRPEQEQPQQEPQRPAPPGGGTSTAPAASAAGTASDCEHRQPPQPLDAASRGRYVVVLDGVEVSYDVCSVSGRILVRGAAARAAAAARGRAGDV